MKKTALIIISVILFVPLCLHASGSRPEGKPASPLSVTIRTVDESLRPDSVGEGDLLELEVILVSHAEFEMVSLEVKLPGRIELIGGELEWSGPLEAGGEIVLPISLKLLKEGPLKIKARASSRLSGSASFSASDTFRVGQDKEGKPFLPPVKQDSKGRNIIEHRL